MKSVNPTYRGITAIYKPKGPTSHQMINRLRHHTGVKKIGHAGTLDPLAEGVLVIAIGRKFTKQLHSWVDKEKEYEATIKLGQTSITDDAEGIQTSATIQEFFDPGIERIKEMLPTFTGQIWQIPPVYSAVKVNGKEAYKRARRGEKITLTARLRTVKEIEVLAYRWPLLNLRIVTKSGVYIRSLARDLGKQLHTGGYLANLVRTRVGQYTLKAAYSVPRP